VIAAYVRWMTDLGAGRNPVRLAWDHLHGKPGGTKLFLAAVRGWLPVAPPRGTRVCDLRPGHAALEVDSIAPRGGADPIADLATLAAHLSVAYALPDGRRVRGADRAWTPLQPAQGAVIVSSTLVNGWEDGGRDGSARWTAKVEARDATGDRCGVGEVSFDVAPARAG
jgi:hypothetical protein